MRIQITNAENQITPCPEVKETLVKAGKQVLTFLFSVLLLVAVSAAIVSTYQRTANSALELSRQLMLGIGDVIIQRTDDIVTVAKTQLETNVILATSTVATPNSVIKHQDDWLNLFWQQMQMHEYINSIYLADVNGNMVQARKLPRLSTRIIRYQPEQSLISTTYRKLDYEPLAHKEEYSGYDPRVRPWFPQHHASTGKESRMTDLYRFESTKKPGITVSRDYLDADNRLQGVFAADISLQGLSDLLSKQTFGRKDIAIIINGWNELVAYPTRLKLTRNAQDTIRQTGALADIEMLSEDQTWVAKAWQLYQQTQPVNRTYSDATENDFIYFSHDASDYAAVVLPFGESFDTDWKLLLVAPEEDLLGDVKRSLQENMTLTASILLFFLFILYLLFGRKWGTYP